MGNINHKDKIKYKIERINIGDIALCYNDKIICIIERKTWNDPSIIDPKTNKPYDWNAVPHK